MNRILSPTPQKFAALLILAVCGCAHYRPDPLPKAPDLTETPQLTVPAKQFWLSGLSPHPVSPEGLDETTVAMLAVFNNPDLKAARLQAGVAGAQVMEAGLLPDPQFDASFATSALNYGGVLGLSQDIRSLLTRGAAKGSAGAAQQQVNLNILWQEWQVAERARELFIQLRADAQVEDVLNATHALLQDRYDRDRTAMGRGDETSITVAADLNALADADTSIRQLQSEIILNRHDLNALLGLQPDAQLHLIGEPETPALTQPQFEAALATLPHHRADLLALQAGYQSQEENLRRAVLEQFPSMSAGVEFERDPVEGVNAVGPQVTMTLPIFNRNRGQIAIQRATREVLHETYQARLDAAAGQADQVWKTAQTMSAQLNDLDAQLPLLEESAAAAEKSFRQHNLNPGLYVSACTNYLAKEVESIRLRASLLTAQSTLHALLGVPFNAY